MITTDDLKKRKNDLYKEWGDLISLECVLNKQLETLDVQINALKDKACIYRGNYVYRCLSRGEFPGSWEDPNETETEKQLAQLITQYNNIKQQLAPIKPRLEKINTLNWNLDRIRENTSQFIPELIMPKIAKLLSSFEKKDYRYYEITKVIKEFESNKTSEVIERFFSTSKNVVSFYPLDYFDIFRDSDNSMIQIWEKNSREYIVFHEISYDGGYRFLMGNHSTDYVIKNEVGKKVSGNYIKDFIDKVIDYRLTKMYPNSVLEESTTWQLLSKNQENEDITSEEIDVILADFIINYKNEFKEKTKHEKFLVKNNFSWFPKKKS